MLKKLLLMSIVIYACCCAGIAAAAEQLRVAVVDWQSTAELQADEDFRVVDGYGQTMMRKGKYFVHIVDGKLQFDDAHIFHNGAKVVPAEGKLLQVNKRNYKGNFVFAVQDEKLSAINQIDMEEYLASVLPSKTMVVWPDEAIKAQAVAARSYALHAKQTHGKQDYDILALDEELRYEGTGKRIEKLAVTKLIAATRGQYLVDNDGKYVWARSTSSTGGRTEAESAYGLSGHAYLRSVDDYDDDSLEYTWQRVVTPALLESYLAQGADKIVNLTSIRLSTLQEPGADRTPTGRVLYVVINGSGGSTKMTGTQFAKILDLPSTLFDIEVGNVAPDKLNVPIEDRYGMEIGSKDIDIKTNVDTAKPVWKNMLHSYHMLSGAKEEKLIIRGKGKGSGLGLSAWGARGMTIVNPKITYAEILQHYYPGTRLVK